MRTPCNGFDRRPVLAESPSRACVQAAPHEELVVVTSGSELICIGVPTQSAHLLLVVSSESADIMLRSSCIAMQNRAVARARRENVVVPRQTSNTTSVACHSPDASAVLRIPDFDCPAICTDCQSRSLDVSRDLCQTIENSPCWSTLDQSRRLLSPLRYRSL